MRVHTMTNIPLRPELSKPGTVMNKTAVNNSCANETLFRRLTETTTAVEMKDEIRTCTEFPVKTIVNLQ